MTPTSYAPLIQFLTDELSVSDSSISLALRQVEQDPAPLHMVLWQYGLITLEQLDRIFDWLETA
jgi:hypothetical protein